MSICGSSARQIKSHSKVSESPHLWLSVSTDLELRPIPVAFEEIGLSQLSLLASEVLCCPCKLTLISGTVTHFPVLLHLLTFCIVQFSTMVRRLLMLLSLLIVWAFIEGGERASSTRAFRFYIIKVFLDLVLQLDIQPRLYLNLCQGWLMMLIKKY